MSSEPESAARARFGRVIVVWVAAAVIGVLVGVLTPAGQRAAWLTIGLAACLVVAFAVQLSSGSAHRFISRVAASMLGSFVILAVISAGFGLAALIAA